MRKKTIVSAFLTLCMLGGMLAVGITTRGIDLNHNFMVNAALPEGSSSISFTVEGGNK